MANEVRLINVAPLMTDGWVLERHGISNCDVGRMSLADVPTVDAVPVVRCRECKYRKTERCQMYWESEDGREQYSWETDDDFCSSGKRRDDDD